jgi:hypothetical protein
VACVGDPGRWRAPCRALFRRMVLPSLNSVTTAGVEAQNDAMWQHMGPDLAIAVIAFTTGMYLDSARLVQAFLKRHERLLQVRPRHPPPPKRPYPGLIRVSAEVDPETLFAATMEVDNRRRAGEDVTYELVIGEWADRSRPSSAKFESGTLRS